VTECRDEIAGVDRALVSWAMCFDDNINICVVEAGMIRGAGVKESRAT
jgi:hypothetical protein